MRIKLSPAQNSGDCGYHVILLGLIYLALRARDDKNIASLLNSSEAISSLLSDNRAYPRNADEKIFKTNHERLLDYLYPINAASFYSPLLTETLLALTLQLKQITCSLGWLQDRIQNEIKSGLWIETNRHWDKLPTFQRIIMKKIEMKADVLYEKAVKDTRGQPSDELLSEILFNAQIEACAELTPNDLATSSKEVIIHFYTSGAPPAWVDIDFLRVLVGNLVSEPKILFDSNNINITGDRSNPDHWYLELPNDEYTQQFISAYNQAAQVGLDIIYPQTNISVALSSCSYFSPPGNDRDKNAFSNTAPVTDTTMDISN